MLRKSNKNNNLFINLMSDYSRAPDTPSSKASRDHSFSQGFGTPMSTQSNRRSLPSYSQNSVILGTPRTPGNINTPFSNQK